MNDLPTPTPTPPMPQMVYTKSTREHDLGFNYADLPAAPSLRRAMHQLDAWEAGVDVAGSIKDDWIAMHNYIQELHLHIAYLSGKLGQ